MQTVYIGNTLINDIFLGSQRMDDVFTPLASIQAEYLIVASGNYGGSSGGSPSRRGGGGGAGGLLSGSLSILPNINYFIQVGGFDANNIAYQSYITGSNIYSVATGGGTGGNGGFTDGSKNGANGGSGGGGGYFSSNQGTAGTGIVGQGNDGNVATTSTGGGGGGAGSVGVSGAAGGAGGSGKASAINGTLTTYSVGGNGGSNNDGVNFGDGGGSATAATRGTPKVGVVILRYLGPQKFVGGTVTTDGAYTIQTFNNTTNTIGAAYDRFTIMYS